MMPNDSLTAKQFQELVEKKNAEVDRKTKRKSGRSNVHSTKSTFDLEKADEFMKGLEPVLRKHFTGVVYEEIDRDCIEIRTNERWKVRIEIKKV